MHTLTLAQLAKGLSEKKFSSLELTQHLLKRIQKLDPQYNSFITVCEDAAIARAKLADQQRAAGQAKLLTGLPMAHKDIFCTQDIKTSCGSKMLDNFLAPYDATVVQQLNTQGMVMLGKTNMDEFAMGSSNETSFYGPVKNPWDTTTVPGGSSGGSAAAVAARLVPAATGTDTGGSIRQPAALCGITGIKPTYGRVSRFGMIAFASSLDQGGPMTQTAEDAAMVLNAMAGFDEKDSTCVDQPVPDYTATLNDSLKGKTIGLPKEYFEQGLDKAVEQSVQDAIKAYEKMGVKVKEISLPSSPLSVSVYYIVASAECSSNLSRYDGVRFGYRCENPINLEDLYKRTRSEGFGSEVKRRIMIGTYALSAGYYDAYYLKAQKVRQLIANEFKKAFQEVDIIAGPTAPSVAFRIGEKVNDPVEMYLSDIYTIATNLAGLPGMSIPCGFVKQMPVGLQLIGNHFTEGLLLNFGHQYQQQTDWHSQIPESCT
ncbi:Asp-tRNA(Asn)/Glu-tRNA(Gln) amidotransferase subunit GatA [Candidatus Berkiella cookevillensis]|uniref:Glutamyl-tRNA(Gln) amidotransferase subunit A n=1 Tax=Candidatus Berkiella cookevillensis TaxID=437022 RepID=A0A0Q9YB12_9GAMM|nr:Asp-tRNA(Asn)/Glu-tRNA(Gln) amidotransferase subunit GatA [Candidatus Berkiella cookevillensis]MCS5709025.1 Asp-tRNA(Asn)/Glu-tRNA(Gln) amidotransferase subunit GatA [Candidatus Berkiella cookevillensis]